MYTTEQKLEELTPKTATKKEKTTKTTWVAKGLRTSTYHSAEPSPPGARYRNLYSSEPNPKDSAD